MSRTVGIVNTDNGNLLLNYDNGTQTPVATDGTLGEPVPMEAEWVALAPPTADEVAVSNAPILANMEAYSTAQASLVAAKAALDGFAAAPNVTDLPGLTQQAMAAHADYEAVTNPDPALIDLAVRCQAAVTTN